MSTKKNQRKHLTDLNSDMGLTTRNLQSSIVVGETPYYYEVKLNNHPNGLTQLHCGSKIDRDRIIEMYPDSTWQKIYLPHPPQTIDVPHVVVAPDLELPMQQILPESDLQPLEL